MPLVGACHLPNNIVPQKRFTGPDLLFIVKEGFMFKKTKQPRGDSTSATRGLISDHEGLEQKYFMIENTYK